ncbi:MAG: prepilin peptidase [Planctomycetia bacterium]|nr:prepilin peptidase [Planctomycetia bacterium]
MDGWIVASPPHGLPVAEAAALAGCVALGAVVGSFLNVVVHRVPRGESVVFGGSRCPACGSAIRSRDNIPVLGWLLLRGRCRDCQSTISPRYPLVEAACAAVVGTVAAVELLSGGGNLPETAAVVGGGCRRGIDVLLFGTGWRLAGTFLLHCSLLVTLLSWAVLEMDVQPVPRRWFRATLAAVAIACLVWPWLQPVGLVPAALWRPDAAVGDSALGADVPPWLRAIALVAAGAGTGWAVGRCIGSRTVRDGLTVIGAVMGWQAAVQVGLVLIAVRWLVNALRKTAARAAGLHCLPHFEGACLLVSATLVLCSWGAIDGATEAVCRRVAAAWQADKNGL